MNITVTSIQERDHFPGAIREALHSAQQWALHMDAMEVTPEQLFLGVVMQHDDSVTATLSALRLDQRMILERSGDLWLGGEPWRGGRGGRSSVPKGAVLPSRRRP